MALDAALLEILACPEDKGPLYYFPDEDVLYNPRLARVYDVRDDIPVMLIDEARTRRRRRGRAPAGRASTARTSRRPSRRSSSFVCTRRADPIGASRPRPASPTPTD